MRWRMIVCRSGPSLGEGHRFPMTATESERPLMVLRRPAATSAMQTLAPET